MRLRHVDAASARVEGLRLGFGCSSLGGSLDHRAQCRVVEAAYEAGFRHFDVAPSYAHGEAEHVLGTVLAGVRSEVSIVTKAGIAHPTSTGALKQLRRIVAPLKPILPGLWRVASRKAGRLAAPTGRFAPAQVEASLAESLKRLRRDSVDALLLHVVSLADLNPELLECLDGLVASRLVGAVGTGTGVDESIRIAAMHPARFGVFQTNHYWGSRTMALRTPSHPLITYGAIRAGLDLLHDAAFLRAVEGHARHRELKSAFDDPQATGNLFLLAALQRCFDGLVLVSTSRPEGAKGFIDVARRAELNPLAAALNECLDRMAPGPGQSSGGV